LNLNIASSENADLPLVNTPVFMVPAPGIEPSFQVLQTCAMTTLAQLAFTWGDISDLNRILNIHNV
jgi:hypothetical protein